MKISRWMAPALALVATAASAVTMSVTPANPTPADTLVLELTDTNPCASIVPNSLEMLEARTIKVTYNDGANIMCVAPVGPVKVTLGRFPAGAYTVQLVPLNPNPAANLSTQVTVVNSAGGPNDPPFDDYSGLYQVAGTTDGVSVQQFGRKAFVSYLYHGPDGKPTWAVMPDAKWEVGPGGGFRFYGGVYKTDIVPSGGTGVLTSIYLIGTGSFVPFGIFDEGRLEIDQAGGPRIEVNVKRLRF